MIGIIVTVSNNYENLFHCFESLKRAKLDNCIIAILDDCTENYKVGNLIADFQVPLIQVIKTRTSIKLGVNVSTRLVIDSLLQKCDFFITIDSDMMVRKDFVEQLMSLPKDSVVTGGANIAFTKDIYYKYIEAALICPGNWQHQVNRKVVFDGKSIYCTNQVVVKKTGFNSFVGMVNVPLVDSASDFYLYDLPNVTLVGIDSNYPRIRKSIDKCTKYIRWGDVKILSHIDGQYVNKIPQIKSKQEYSQFVLKQLANYIDTEYFLIVQHDAWILNPSAWDHIFFEFDYIGAIWKWYSDSFRVGNGGFSFRSTKLARILQQDQNIVLRNDHGANNYAEDHNICRIYGRYLKDKYNIKFATEKIADNFSVENWNTKPPANKYNGSFGFHGFGSIDYTDSYITPPRP